MFDTAIFKTLSLEDLEVAKTGVAEAIKARKDEAKALASTAKAKAVAEKDAEVKALIDTGEIAVGKTVRFTFKGAERTATVEKITDKTFTVELTEGKRYIKFSAFLGL
jgi:plastocyanin